VGGSHKPLVLTGMTSQPIKPLKILIAD